jgi:uncharacterized membrane protein
MKALIENIKAGLYLWGELAEVLLNTASLLIIILGVGLSLVRSFRQRQREPGDHPLHTYFRKIFGGWLIVALEFQLAADIVGTIISPTTSHLIELGAIALIRTFLNYFLNKELREEVEAERKKKMKSEKQVGVSPEN